MKAFAIDCSGHYDNSTSKLLSAFLDGIKSEDIEVNDYKISDLNILPCKECYKEVTFEYTTDCQCDDDMNALYPVFRDADYWVFAAPISKNSSLTYFKNLLDRMEPLFQPVFFENSPPVQLLTPDQPKKGKVIFISVVDDELVDKSLELAKHIESLSFIFHKEFAGSLFRNNGEQFHELSLLGIGTTEILEQMVQAGKELAKYGKLNSDTIKSINSPLISRKEIVEKLNISL